MKEDRASQQLNGLERESSYDHLDGEKKEEEPVASSVGQLAQILPLRGVELGSSRHLCRRLSGWVGGAAASTRLQAAAAAAPSERGRLPTACDPENCSESRLKCYAAFFRNNFQNQWVFSKKQGKTSYRRYYYFFLELGRLKI